MITVNPGAQISTLAAADLPARETERTLEELARTHLIEPGEPFGWWRTHDLVRLYATDLAQAQADADHRDQANDRLFTHYLTAAMAADTAWPRPPDWGPCSLLRRRRWPGRMPNCRT
ncbi:hypothetical protein [Actinomadura sp. DC4]|uniref:hypothetical protein n=1 Tax=Actinomadura sp. DC4 TaxID=3055069 RepID=UPI0025B07108|nr:hypothetical protein [Actinomadura sp. DC4]MDN3351752.1 hypothetical protein [Actinomadura sp. DC4]